MSFFKKDSFLYEFSGTMLDPKTPEQRSKRFWTAAGGLQYGALLFSGGPGAAMGAAAGLTAYAAFDGLRMLAESENNTFTRDIAREAIGVMFGIEGENSQVRRRFIDVGLSLGVAALMGGATVAGLTAGLATGAVLTMITTWQKGADPEWFKEGSLLNFALGKATEDPEKNSSPVLVVSPA